VDPDTGEPVRGGCDGICKPPQQRQERRRDSQVAREELDTIAQAILLWTQATTDPAVAGGGRIDAELAARALGLPFATEHPRQIARDALSLLVVARGESFFIHPEDPHFEEEHFVADLSADPCRAAAGLLMAQALAEELRRPGSGSERIEQIRSTCTGELPFEGPCTTAEDVLACIKALVKNWAAHYSGSPPFVCAVDCDGSATVTVNEVVAAVNVALGNAAIERCEEADTDGNGAVTVDELIQGVNHVLLGCPL
jgi:hypothetical protein